MKGKAKFRIKGHVGELLCSRCSAVIKESKYFTDEELKAMKGEIKLKPQYCDECESKLIYE
jgi:NAD-dependent SIR2 family protein deacetylase